MLQQPPARRPRCPILSRAHLAGLVGHAPDHLGQRDGLDLDTQVVALVYVAPAGDEGGFHRAADRVLAEFAAPHQSGRSGPDAHGDVVQPHVADPVHPVRQVPEGEGVRLERVHRGAGFGHAAVTSPTLAPQSKTHIARGAAWNDALHQAARELHPFVAGGAAGPLVTGSETAAGTGAPTRHGAIHRGVAVQPGARQRRARREKPR